MFPLAKGQNIGKLNQCNKLTVHVYVEMLLLFYSELDVRSDGA